MRYLVLGASGMAGHMILTYLGESGEDVVAFSRRAVPGFDCVVGDVRNVDHLRWVIERGGYDIVVNCVGLLNQEAETHRPDAIFVNSLLPHILVDAVANLRTRIVQISTDCVFAGNTGPYLESSIPDGITVYDKTKALGEIDDDRNLTLRQSIVGPDVNHCGIGLLNWFMRQESEVLGYKNSIWTGLTTLELAKAIFHCSHDGICGLVNMVPDSSISKYRLLCLFNEFLCRGSKKIIPFENELLDKTLVRGPRDYCYVPQSYERQIEDLRNWISRHPGIYPKYYYQYM